MYPVSVSASERAERDQLEREKVSQRKQKLQELECLCEGACVIRMFHRERVGDIKCVCVCVCVCVCACMFAGGTQYHSHSLGQTHCYKYSILMVTL